MPTSSLLLFRLLSVKFAFIFGAKWSNIKPFFKFAKPKDLGNVLNRKPLVR